MVTIPGRYGILAALSNRVLLASCISCWVNVLITRFAFFFALVSGFSINPAGTTGWLLCELMHNGMSLFRRTVIENVQRSEIACVHSMAPILFSARGCIWTSDVPCFRLRFRRHHVSITRKSNTNGHCGRGFRTRVFQETSPENLFAGSCFNAYRQQLRQVPTSACSERT